MEVSNLGAQAATSVLFIGNSFTFGYGSAMRFYRADTIRDLNHEGQGGVPALFKSFTQQYCGFLVAYISAKPLATAIFNLRHGHGDALRRLPTASAVPQSI